MISMFAKRLPEGVCSSNLNSDGNSKEEDEVPFQDNDCFVCRQRNMWASIVMQLDDLSSLVNSHFSSISPLKQSNHLLWPVEMMFKCILMFYLLLGQLHILDKFCYG